jgi:DNA-directed RNA polymerase specialized sigma subunit
LRMLLVYYYIDCLTWKQVGRKLNYSKATVMRKHTEAVEMVKKSNLVKKCKR